MEAIVVDDIHFSYNGVPVLKGVSFTIKMGQVVAIMGENGAGKTTLIKHFIGLLKPDVGRVLVFGTDTREASVAQLAKRVGIVFQNPDHQLFAESVEEEIFFTLENMGYTLSEAKAICDTILKTFELDRYRNRSPYSLSIGERKRLTIAAVLCYNPDVVVLDEPTAGQDYYNKSKLSRLITQLKRQGRGVVVVTHDVEFAAQTVERVILVANGQVIQDGPAQDILTDAALLQKARLLPPQIPVAASKLMANGIRLSAKPLLAGGLYTMLVEMFNHSG